VFTVAVHLWTKPQESWNRSQMHSPTQRSYLGWPLSDLRPCLNVAHMSDLRFYNRFSYLMRKKEKKNHVWLRLGSKSFSLYLYMWRKKFYALPEQCSKQIKNKYHVMGPSPNRLTGTPQKATAHFGGTISSSGSGHLGKIWKRTYKTIKPWTDYFRR